LYDALFLKKNTNLYSSARTSDGTTLAQRRGTVCLGMGGRVAEPALDASGYGER
jgi:hypothetical protein